MIIKINNLTKVYPDGTEALVDLSFDIKSGECFGILGPNGAGKTTLLKVLKGLLIPSAGSFSIGKVIIDPSTDNSRIKGLTSYLPDDPPEFPTITAHEYLSMVAILYQVPESLAEERIEKFLELFRLDQWTHKPLGVFSEGMKQKVHWIAALIHDPPIILLDDPLRALDVHSFQLITELLDRLKNLGKTVLLSTHYLALAEKTCDHLAIIHNGHLVTMGSIQEILAKTQCNNLFEAYIDFFPRGLPSEDIERLEI